MKLKPHIAPVLHETVGGLLVVGITGIIAGVWVFVRGPNQVSVAPWIIVVVALILISAFVVLAVIHRRKVAKLIAERDGYAIKNQARLDECAGEILRLKAFHAQKEAQSAKVLADRDAFHAADKVQIIKDHVATDEKNAQRIKELQKEVRDLTPKITPRTPKPISPASSCPPFRQ